MKSINDNNINTSMYFILIIWTSFLCMSALMYCTVYVICSICSKYYEVLWIFFLYACYGAVNQYSYWYPKGSHKINHVWNLSDFVTKSICLQWYLYFTTLYFYFKTSFGYKTIWLSPKMQILSTIDPLF